MNHLSALVSRAMPAGGAERAGNLGGLLLGMSLGAVWTPCAGPVLASILVLVAQAQDLGRSAGLLLLYALAKTGPLPMVAGFVAREQALLAATRSVWGALATPPPLPPGVLAELPAV